MSSMSDEKLRVEYLIEWRRSLWQSIRQKEDGIWKFVSFFSGALLLLAGFASTVNPKEVDLPFAVLSMMLIVIPLAYWGCIIVLDANYWLTRNLIFISNIEKVILKPDDIGKLIPEYYANPDFQYSRPYSVHIQVLFGLIALILFVGGMNFFSADSFDDVAYFLLGYLLLIVFSLSHYTLVTRERRWVRDYYQVRKDAPGYGSSPKIKTYAAEEKITKSPIFGWEWFIALFATGLFTAICYLNQDIINIRNGVYWKIVSLGVLIGLLGFGTTWVLNMLQKRKRLKTDSLFKIISNLSIWLQFLFIAATILFWSFVLLLEKLPSLI